MSCIEPVEALMVLDSSSIPASNDYLFLMYGENDISTAFDFYGKPAEDDFEGHKSYSPPLLNCTVDFLKLEYGGYKTYAATHKNKVKGELELQWKSLTAKLICTSAQKYKRTQEIKVIETEIAETKGKILAPVTALDLLDHSVVESAFPNIRKLLRLYVLIPQSEAVVERGFSKMKLIMTDKRTRLEPESLSSLIRISYNSEPLSMPSLMSGRPVAVVSFLKASKFSWTSYVKTYQHSYG